MSTPGAMTPPTYAPAALSTSNVVAKPRSTTMHGPPSRSTAATALATLSVPTSRGLSMRTGSPVLTPGSRITVATPAKCRVIASRSSCRTAGTVEDTTMPSGSRASTDVSSPAITRPHSSAVRLAGVATRQWFATRSPSSSPTAVESLRTSMASRLMRHLRCRTEDQRCVVDEAGAADLRGNEHPGRALRRGVSEVGIADREVVERDARLVEQRFLSSRQRGVQPRG